MDDIGQVLSGDRKRNMINTAGFKVSLAEYA
jgi:hypothetical protein